MEKAEIIEWALKSGFVLAGLNTFEAPYEDMQVRLVLGHKFVTTYLVRGDEADIIVKTRPDLIDLNLDGMIHGAGLESRFVDRIHRGGAVPCWFPTRHAAAALEDASGSRPTRRGLAWPDIAEWAAANGFERVHKCLFVYEHGEKTISLNLLPRKVAALISDPEGERYLGVRGYDEIFVDSDGILRGVGLKDGFVEEVVEGEDPPCWFGEDLVETLRARAGGHFRIAS